MRPTYGDSKNVVKAAAQVSDENLEPVMGQSVAENDPSTSAAPNAAGAEVSPTGTTTSADAPSAAVNTQGPEEVNMFNSPWQSTDPNAQSPFDPVAPADETLSQGEAPLDRTKNPTLPNEPLTIAPPEPVRPNPAHAAAPDSDDDSFPPSYLTGPVIKQKALAQLDRLMDGMKIDTNKVLHPYQEDPGGAFGIFYPIAIVCHCTHLANQAVQNALIGMGLRE